MPASVGNGTHAISVQHLLEDVMSRLLVWTLAALSATALVGHAWAGLVNPPTTNVPEPASMALLGSAVSVIAIALRRRKVAKKALID
jgi:hypothetical protein